MNTFWWLVVDADNGSILEGFNTREGAEHFVKFRNKHDTKISQYGQTVRIVPVKEQKAEAWHLPRT